MTPDFPAIGLSAVAAFIVMCIIFYHERSVFMSQALDNLNANIAALNGTVAAAVAKIQNAPNDDAAVQSAADAVAAANAQLAAMVNP